MNKVFLSHSSKDKAFVRMLSQDIQASGVGVWIDEVEILVGDSLIRKISEGLAAANYVIACLSEASVGSNWVKEELEIAATLGIEGNRVFILPLRLDDCVFPLFLRHRLYCDFRQAIRYDQAFDDLLQRINPEALPKTAYSFYSLTIGATRKDRLVQTAANPAMKDWILDYLIGTIDKRDRHTERHFTYLALGEIGGEKAEDAVRKGLTDRNDFARSGAEKAWKMLGGKDKEDVKRTITGQA